MDKEKDIKIEFSEGLVSDEDVRGPFRCDGIVELWMYDVELSKDSVEKIEHFNKPMESVTKVTAEDFNMILRYV